MIATSIAVFVRLLLLVLQLAITAVQLCLGVLLNLRNPYFFPVIILIFMYLKYWVNSVLESVQLYVDYTIQHTVGSFHTAIVLIAHLFDWLAHVWIGIVSFVRAVFQVPCIIWENANEIVDTVKFTLRRIFCEDDDNMFEPLNVNERAERVFENSGFSFHDNLFPLHDYLTVKHVVALLLLVLVIVTFFTPLLPFFSAAGGKFAHFFSWVWRILHRSDEDNMSESLRRLARSPDTESDPQEYQRPSSVPISNVSETPHNSGRRTGLDGNRCSTEHGFCRRVNPGVEQSRQDDDSASPYPTLERLQQEEKNQCVVCQDMEKNTLLMPCRHLCLCELCAARILNRRECPICREYIEEIVHVYV